MCVYSVRHVRAPPVIARVCIYSLDGAQTPLKARKRAARSSGSAVSSKWLTLATSDVDVFHYNPNVRPAPSTLLSSMSAHISHQPSLNAQWQKPHCEDSTLSSDRAARWTVQQQGGTWYQCQQSDLTLQEQLYVCIWKWGRTVPKDCREHMCWWRPERVLKWRLMNERPEWVHVCVWMKLKGQWNVRQRENKLELLFTQCARACACVCGKV